METRALLYFYEIFRKLWLVIMYVMNRIVALIRSNLLELLVFSLSLLLYTYTAPPHIFSGDSAELTTAAATGGYAHPPGYPLYSLLGSIWIKVFALGTIGWRMNMFSVIWAALCVVVIFKLVFALTKHRIAAVISACTVVVANSYWLYGIVAEVFSLHAFLNMLLLYAVVQFYLTKKLYYTYVAAIAFSLEIAHQHLVILSVPGILVVLLAMRFWKHISAKHLVALFVISVSGLLWYLYLPLSKALSGIYYWGSPDTLSGVIDLFLRRQYGTFDITHGGSSLTLLQRLEYVKAFLMLYAFNYGIPGLLLTCIGIVYFLKKRTTLAISFFLIFIVTSIIFLVYAGLETVNIFRLGMMEKFSVFPIAVGGIFIGYGVLWVSQNKFIQRYSALLKNRSIPFVIAGLMFVLPLYLLVNHWDTLNLRTYWEGWYLGVDTLMYVPDYSFVGVSGDTMSFNTRYINEVERPRRNIIITNSPREPVIIQTRRLLGDLQLEPSVPIENEQFINEMIKKYPTELSYFVRSQVTVPSGYELVPVGALNQVLLTDTLPPREETLGQLRHFLNNSLMLNQSGLDTSLPPLADSIRDDYGLILNNIGWYLIHEREYEAAQEVFKKGSSIDPGRLEHTLGFYAIEREKGNCQAAGAILDAYNADSAIKRFTILREKAVLYRVCYKDEQKVNELLQELELIPLPGSTSGN